MYLIYNMDMPMIIDLYILYVLYDIFPYIIYPYIIYIYIYPYIDI